MRRMIEWAWSLHLLGSVSCCLILRNLSVRRRVLNSCRDLLRMGDVHCMARTWHLDRVTVGTLGIPPLQFGIDGSVRTCDQHPTRLAPPRSGSDDGFEVVGEIWHLRPRHECGLIRRQISCEIFVEL